MSTVPGGARYERLPTRMKLQLLWGGLLLTGAGYELYRFTCLRVQPKREEHFYRFIKNRYGPGAPALMIRDEPHARMIDSSAPDSSRESDMVTVDIEQIRAEHAQRLAEIRRRKLAGERVDEAPSEDVVYDDGVVLPQELIDSAVNEKEVIDTLTLTNMLRTPTPGELNWAMQDQMDPRRIAELRSHNGR